MEAQADADMKVAEAEKKAAADIAAANKSVEDA